MFICYDFETLGQTPDTIVVSLGAVAFNRDGVLGKKYWVFDWENQPGRTQDPETVAWWDRQSPEARLVFNTPKKDRISLEQWVEENDRFIEGISFELGEPFDKKTNKWKELRPISNGANFDCVIIEDIYRKIKGKEFIPYPFWNVWCFRTFDHLFKIKEKMPKNEAGKAIVKHNALADALWQAECVLEFWKRQDALKQKGLK